jgi:hypothetical protein
MDGGRGLELALHVRCTWIAMVEDIADNANEDRSSDKESVFRDQASAREFSLPLVFEKYSVFNLKL